MKFQYSLGIENDNVKEKLNSEQFRLSEKLMDKRFELNLSIEEMAKITHLDVVSYLKLEYGETETPVAEFETALQKIEVFEIKENLSFLETKTVTVEVVNKTNLIWSLITINDGESSNIGRSDQEWEVLLPVA